MHDHKMQTKCTACARAPAVLLLTNTIILLLYYTLTLKYTLNKNMKKEKCCLGNVEVLKLKYK